MEQEYLQMTTVWRRYGVNKNGKVYILLPGPPKEMKPMYVSYVEPFYVILQQEKTFILVCFVSSVLGSHN